MERPMNAAKKCAAYAMAGTAIGVPAAKAAPIYVDVADVTYLATTANPLVQVPFDINADGVPDFGLALAALSGTMPPANAPYKEASASWISMSGNAVAIDVFSYPMALHPGTDAVGGFLTYGTGSQLLSLSLKSSLSTRGNWPNDLTDPRYIGLRFMSGTDTHYGWARVGVADDVSSPAAPSAAAIVYGFGYESTPGYAIIVGAGETNDAAIPEPSSFALLALGATGIAVLKRRRG
jgi:PEP-CTERM motif